MRKITKKNIKTQKHKHTLRSHSNKKQQSQNKKNTKRQTKNNKKNTIKGGMVGIDFWNPFSSNSTKKNKADDDDNVKPDNNTPIKYSKNLEKLLEKVENSETFKENLLALSYIHPDTWKSLIKHNINELKDISQNNNLIKYDEKGYFEALNCPSRKKEDIGKDIKDAPCESEECKQIFENEELLDKYHNHNHNLITDTPTVGEAVTTYNNIPVAEAVTTKW